MFSKNSGALKYGIISLVETQTSSPSQAWEKVPISEKKREEKRKGIKKKFLSKHFERNSGRSRCSHRKPTRVEHGPSRAPVSRERPGSKRRDAAREKPTTTELKKTPWMAFGVPSPPGFKPHFPPAVVSTPLPLPGCHSKPGPKPRCSQPKAHVRNQKNIKRAYNAVRRPLVASTEAPSATATATTAPASPSAPTTAPATAKAPSASTSVRHVLMHACVRCGFGEVAQLQPLP